MGNLTERRHHTHLFAYHNTVSMSASAIGSFIGGYLPAMIAPFLSIFSSPTKSQSAYSHVYGIALGIAGIIVIVSVIPLLRIPEQHARDSMHEAAPRVRNAPSPC